MMISSINILSIHSSHVYSCSLKQKKTISKLLHCLSVLKSRMEGLSGYFKVICISGIYHCSREDILVLGKIYMLFFDKYWFVICIAQKYY